MNQWQAIKEFYEFHEKTIMESSSEEWAIPVYSWNGIIPLMTPIEDALWEDIRQANAIFYPQWPVAGFFVDFANPKAKVALECDGKQFHKDKTKDADRDEKLNALGWTVYRFPGWLCVAEFDEETMQCSESRKLIDEICVAHRVQRNKVAQRWKAFEEFFGDRP